MDPNKEVGLERRKGNLCGWDARLHPISLALYFSGRREAAIFVGLWAPTILNLGQTLVEDD